MTDVLRFSVEKKFVQIKSLVNKVSPVVWNQNILIPTSHMKKKSYKFL